MLPFGHKQWHFLKGFIVAVDTKVGWIEVQENTGIAVLAQASPMATAQSLAAELSGCCNIDDVTAKIFLYVIFNDLAGVLQRRKYKVSDSYWEAGNKSR